jgi:type IV secretion system protein VirD4
MHRLWAFGCRLTIVVAIGLAALGTLALGLVYPWLLVLAILGVAWRNSRGWRGSWSHGTARMATMQDLIGRGMLRGDDGIIIGRAGMLAHVTRWQAIRSLFSLSVPSDTAVGQFASAFYGSRWMAERIIRIKDAVHCAAFSRTGGGKGVSVVIPNLLSYRGSVVVIDPKCENFFKTFQRRKRMGSTIVRLDPMLLGGPGAASFNPLSFIDAKAPDFLDQCRDLANMLVVRQGTEHEPHWNDSAELVLTAMICFVCACEADPAERTLATVRILVSDRDKFAKAIEVMRRMDNEVVRRLGGQLTWFVDRELGGVLTTVQRHTTWMDSPAVAACLTKNGFDPRDLRRGNVSLYLVVPPDRLVTWAPLIRMWIGSFIKILIREGADERRQVLFMLDEIAQLGGRLQALEDAVAIGRGYGIRLFFIFQSLEQVRACYGEKAGVILDNLSTMLFFALGNALETAELISRRGGDVTIRVTTPNSSYTDGTGTSTSQPGQSINRSSSRGMNVAELGRKLLLPDEILRLPEDVALVFHRNLPVIPALLLRYYNAPEFAGKRTGRRRGLGVAAGIWAMLTLLASILFTGFISGVPVPRSWRGPILSAYARATSWTTSGPQNRASKTAGGRSFDPRNLDVRKLGLQNFDVRDYWPWGSDGQAVGRSPSPMVPSQPMRQRRVQRRSGSSGYLIRVQ